MPTRVITPAQWGAMMHGLPAWMHREVTAAAHEACLHGLRDVVLATNREKLVDTGAFKNAWAVRVDATGAVLEDTAPYAAVLEYGRRPWRPGPPLQPIYEWVRRKNRRTSMTANEAMKLAIVIRRKLHENGSKPRHILGGTIPKITGYFKNEVHRRMRRGPR